VGGSGSKSWNLRDDRSPILLGLTRWAFAHRTESRLRPLGVSDGTRTRDVLDHNQVLYQLSYTHHANGPNMFLDHTAQREVYRAGVGGRNQFWLGATPVSAPRMRSAISFDVVLSGPGSGTNTASR
jgi:hypothetical protein